MTKLETDDFSGHDLELISKWTGTYFGSPDSDPYMLNRALYVLGKRKLGEDTKLTFEQSGAYRMTDVSAWVDENWQIGKKNADEDESADEVDGNPKAGLNSETD
jgi:hypothetical protein